MPPKNNGKWSAEAERDLIMACLTSDNNNYPSINWPKVKDLMDSLGYTFTRSALDQRWSKTIMKEWRERRNNCDTDFTNPTTPNATSARKRGRVESGKKSKQATASIAKDNNMVEDGADDAEEEEDEEDTAKTPKKRARTTKSGGAKPSKSAAATAKTDLMSVPLHPNAGQSAAPEGAPAFPGYPAYNLEAQGARTSLFGPNMGQTAGTSSSTAKKSGFSKTKVKEEQAEDEDEVVFQRERSCTAMPKPEQM